jgi:opacity protein-like surface antigen
MMTNSKLSMAVAAAVALLAAPIAAQAADMPRGGYYKAPPRSVVSYYNWTGFYAGVVAGYGFGSSDWSAVASARYKRSPAKPPTAGSRRSAAAPVTRSTAGCRTSRWAAPTAT